ncbi:hypothetical protein ACNKHR_26010 [Shigella flexneri]
MGPNGAGKSTLLARMASMTAVREAFSSRGDHLEASSTNKTRAASRSLSQQRAPPFCNAGLALPDTASAR